MTHLRLLERSWQRELARPRALVLALLFGAGAVMTLMGALTSGTTPTVTLYLSIMSGAAMTFALVFLVLRERVNDAGAQLGLAFYAVMAGAVAAVSRTPNGVSAIAPGIMVAAMFAGFFLARRAMCWHLALLIGSYFLGAFLAPARLIPVQLMTVGLASCAVGLVLHHLTNRLRESTMLDSLTGAVGRATWWRVAERELATRGSRPLTVAVIDMDGFKQVNDSLGHLAGDQLLRDTTAEWTTGLAGRGLLGRFGGDEFVVLLTGVGLEQSRVVLGELTAPAPARWSLGLAQARPGEGLDDLLDRADRTMFEAKRAESR